MKKLIACASLMALAACGGGEAEPEAMEDADAMEEVAVATDSAVIPGNYDLVYGDGTTGTVMISDDGTYSGTAGDSSVSGTVEDIDGKACFDPEGNAPAVCWTGGDVAEDGSFTSTADDGTVVKVTPAATEG